MSGIGVKQLAHVCVLTHDLKAAERFYCNILGLKKAFNFTRKGGQFGFYLDTGVRTFVEVFENPNAPFAAQGQADHLCLEVANLDKALDVLREHGIEIRDGQKRRVSTTHGKPGSRIRAAPRSNCLNIQPGVPSLSAATGRRTGDLSLLSRTGKRRNRSALFLIHQQRNVGHI